MNKDAFLDLLATLIRGTLYLALVALFIFSVVGLATQAPLLGGVALVIIVVGMASAWAFDRKERRP